MADGAPAGTWICEDCGSVNDPGRGPCWLCRAKDSTPPAKAGAAAKPPAPGAGRSPAPPPPQSPHWLLAFPAAPILVGALSLSGPIFLAGVGLFVLFFGAWFVEVTVDPHGSALTKLIAFWFGATLALVVCGVAGFMLLMIICSGSGGR